MILDIDYKITINHPEEQVLKALKDFKTYPIWWPKKFKTKYFYKKGRHLLVFFPVYPISITWVMEGVNNELKTTYSKGPVKGFGVFKTKKINEYKTEVSYDIQVSPRINIVRTIPLVLIKTFEKIHTFHMKQLFKSLEKHLN